MFLFKLNDTFSRHTVLQIKFISAAQNIRPGAVPANIIPAPPDTHRPAKESLQVTIRTGKEAEIHPKIKVLTVTKSIKTTGPRRKRNLKTCFLEATTTAMLLCPDCLILMVRSLRLALSTKYKFNFYISSDAAFDEADDDPDTVERQCLEIFNNYSGTSGSSTTTEITVSAGDFENSVQSKKRTAHATNMTSDHSVLREKTTKKVHVVKSAQEILYERYKTAEVQPEATGQSQPMRVPLLGLNSKCRLNVKFFKLGALTVERKMKTEEALVGEAAIGNPA